MPSVYKLPNNRAPCTLQYGSFLLMTVAGWLAGSRLSLPLTATVPIVTENYTIHNQPAQEKLQILSMNYCFW